MDDRNGLPSLIHAMSEPGFYPDRPKNVELRQTHISLVFLTDEAVFKVKKPVRFSFLDYSTLENRLHYCEEEVHLNRRLAPNVYWGVVPIWQSGGDFSLGDDDTARTRSAEIVEYAVRMKRLDDERMLDRLIFRGRAGFDDIRAVARILIRFHASARTDRALEYGGPTAVWERIYSNLEETRDFEGSTHSREDGEFVRDYTADFFDRHRALFDARVREQRICEGHGDLRAEHININPEGEIAIFDCIEFNESLRTCDVASEIAFLAMDLDFLDARGLSRELVAVYAEEGRDGELYELLPFYQTYRALVRSKVEGLKSREEEISQAEREKARSRAERYFDLACGYAKGERRPAILVTCGLVGTGKSTLARRLSDRTGFAIFDSDVIRKELAGVDPKRPVRDAPGQGIYTKEFTDRTYAALERKAVAMAGSAEGVILDATYGSAAHRKSLIAQAERLDIPVLFIECAASPEEVRRRLEARQECAESVSDATWEIYERQRETFESLSEEGEEHHRIVETDRPVDHALREIDDFLRPG